jgi:hypothetical protein
VNQRERGGLGGWGGWVGGVPARGRQAGRRSGGEWEGVGMGQQRRAGASKGPSQVGKEDKGGPKGRDAAFREALAFEGVLEAS